MKKEEKQQQKKDDNNNNHNNKDYSQNTLNTRIIQIILRSINPGCVLYARASGLLNI